MATARPINAARGGLIILVNFLPIMAVASMTASLPVMLDHFADRESAGLFVPLIVTAPALMIALLGTFAGQLIDRVGRRKPLVWACLLYGLAGLAPLFLDSLAAIVATRLLLGVAEAALITISGTLIADYWDERGRRFWLTAQGVSGPFLSSGVIALSGILAAQAWNAVFALYFLAFPLAIGCILLVHEPEIADADKADPKIPAQQGQPAQALFKMMAPLLLATLASACLFYVWIVQGGLAFREVGVLDPARQGSIFALAHLAVVFGALLFAGTSRWLSPQLQTSCLLAIMGLGLLLIGLADNESSITLGLLVQQTAAGMSVPTLVRWAHDILPPDRRGMGMGTWSAVFFSGQFISPLLFGASGAVQAGVLDRFVLFGATGLLVALLVFATALTARRNADA